MELLRSYGPDVPENVMKKLVEAFAVLRNMADQGQLTYPYSTRELVNIVKHLQVNDFYGVVFSSYLLTFFNKNLKKDGDQLMDYM